MPKGPENKSVSRFEANLLRLLHFFLQQAPVQQALQLLEAKLERPKCLSRNAVELVKDALAKGCVLLLAGRNPSRLGGWRIERHLRDERIVQGRLWERTPPAQLGLSFSRNTLDFLVWVTAKKLDEDKKGWQPIADLTLGDLLLLYFAYERLRNNEMGGNLLKQPPLDTHGLGWLAFPDDHARSGLTGQPDFKPWVTGLGACLLEAFQPALAERWVEMEVDKGNITGWQQMRDLGLAQERVLDAFLTVVEKEGRYDLARFLLMAAARILPENVTAQLWVKSLRQTAQRLADRAETYRGALAFLRVLPRLQQWAQRARATGYMDEGYQAMQLWLTEWERFEREGEAGSHVESNTLRTGRSPFAGGDVLTQRAQAIIRQQDPMRQTEG
jgi:FtsH ternary system domain X6